MLKSEWADRGVTAAAGSLPRLMMSLPVSLGASEGQGASGGALGLRVMSPGGSWEPQPARRLAPNSDAPEPPVTVPGARRGDGHRDQM